MTDDEDDLQPPELKQSVALPLTVRKRKTLTADIPGAGVWDEDAALATLTAFTQKYGTPEAAFLIMMQKCNIKMDVLQAIGVKKLKYSFSKVTWPMIAPLFDLDPDDLSLGQLGEFRVERSWLPLDIVKKTCLDLELADVQYGQMIQHNNEEARNRYISTLFGRVVYLFKRKVINRPEELIQAQVTDRRRIEHQFVVFGAVVVLFIEVKKELLSGSKRRDQIAQVLAEADACDYRNSDRSLWVPVLGILCDGYDFEFFVYNSSTRELSISARKRGLKQYPGSDQEFLQSIKRSAEYIYDLFLVGYINGLRAFLDKSTNKARTSGTKRVSTERWYSALGFAERSLRLARYATSVAAKGNGVQAERMAVQAIELLDKSLDAAPPRPKEVQSFMGSWSDDAMLKY